MGSLSFLYVLSVFFSNLDHDLLGNLCNLFLQFTSIIDNLKSLALVDTVSSFYYQLDN